MSSRIAEHRRGPAAEVDRWRSVIADLQQQLAAKVAKVKQLGEQRKVLALAAATGDGAKHKRLVLLNQEVISLKLGVEDLEAAIEQAEAKLLEAERELERQAEVERRKRISDLAEQRVELAAKIDAAAAALGQLLAELDQATRAMVLERPGDAGFARRIDPAGRILVALGKPIGAWIGQTGRSDPRHGRSLADLEIEALAPVILTEAGVQRRGRAA